MSQPGPQQYPVGGRPPQQQPGAVPPGIPYQPGGYPQGSPYPQGGQYPVGGYPAGSQYGAPAGYSPAGGYQGGGGQYPGQSPQGQFGQGGFPPGARPPAPKGNKTVLGVVIAAVAAVALLGVLLMIVFGGGSPSVQPTAQPTVVVPSQPPSVEPTSQPTTEPSTPATEEPPSTPASPEPSPGPTQTTQPSGGVEVGLGTSVVPASGWRQSYRDETKNYTELTDDTALLVTQALTVDPGTTGTAMVDAYLQQMAGRLTGSQKGTVSQLNVHAKLSAATGSIRGTRATSQGSVKLTYITIMSVRSADGLTVMATLVTDSKTDPASYKDTYLQMVESLLNSQLNA